MYKGCKGINIGNFLFIPEFWGTRSHFCFWVDWTLAILFIFIFFETKRCTQKGVIFCLESN